MVRAKPLIFPLIAGAGLFGALWALPSGPIAPVIASAFAAEHAVAAPAPRIDPPSSSSSETAIFAGGCFWGVEGVFSHVRGVRSVEAGYAGGPKGRRATYDLVGGGDTGFAEAVRVTYDPRQLRYGTLLRIFFSVITDPTTLNYQGPDHGSQYRSALFPTNAAQDKTARAYLAQLDAAKLWRGPIMTKVEPVGSFQPAEGYHQDFMANNPRHPYILRWDAPKLAAFKAMYPALYSERAAR